MTEATQFQVRQFDDEGVSDFIRPLSVLILAYANRVASDGPSQVKVPASLKSDAGLAAALATSIATYDSLFVAASVLGTPEEAEGAAGLYSEACRVDTVFKSFCDELPYGEDVLISDVLAQVSDFSDEDKANCMATALTLTVLSYLFLTVLTNKYGEEAVQGVVRSIDIV